MERLAEGIELLHWSASDASSLLECLCPEGPRDRPRTSSELLVTFAHRTASRPTLLALDDLDRAPSEVIGQLSFLVRYAARAAVRTRLAVLATSSPLLMSPAAVRTFAGELRAERLSEHLEMPPLSRSQVEHLLEKVLGRPACAKLVRWLHEHSNGLPETVARLLDELEQEGILAFEADTGSVDWPRLKAFSPGTAVTADRRRNWRRLSCPARRILALLAALARPVDAEELARLLRRPSWKWLGELIELARQGWILFRGGAAGALYALSEMDDGKWILSRFPARERRELHRQLLGRLPRSKKALTLQGAADRLRQATLAEDWDEAVEWVAYMDEQASKKGESVKFYEWLEPLHRRLLRGTTGAAHRTVLAALAWAAHLGSREGGEQAARSLLRELRSDPASDPAEVLRWLCFLAICRRQRGRSRAAAHCFRQGREWIESAGIAEDHPEYIEFACREAVWLWDRGDRERASRFLEEAQGTLSGESMRKDLLANVEVHLGILSYRQGSFSKAAGHHRRAGRLYRSRGREQETLLCLINEAAALTRMGLTTEAKRLWLKVREEAARRYDMGRLARAENALGVVELNSGSLPLATERFLRAANYYHLVGEATASLLPKRNAALCLLRMGRVREVERLLKEEARSSWKARSSSAAVHQRIIESTARLSKGELSHALQAIEEACQHGRSLGDGEPLGLALVQKCQILAELGAKRQAEAVLREATALMEGRRILGLCSPVKMAEARLLLETSACTALASAREAARAAQEEGNLYRANQARLLAARCLLQEGRREEALSEANTVCRAATRMEAEPLRIEALTLKSMLSVQKPARIRFLKEARKAVQELELPELASETSFHLSRCYREAGDLKRAIAHLREAFEMAKRSSRSVPDQYLDAHERTSRVQRLEEELERLERRVRERAAGGDQDRVVSRILHRAVAGLEELIREGTPRQISERLLEHTLQASGAERGFVVLNRANGVRVLASRHYDRARIPEPQFAFSRSVARKAMQEGRLILSNDVASDPNLRAISTVKHLGSRSLLCAPIAWRGEVLGALYLDSNRETDAFQEGFLPYTKDFCALAALALCLPKDGSPRSRRATRTPAGKSARRTKRKGSHRQESASTRFVEQGGRASFGPLVGRSAAMQKVYELIETGAAGEFPVVVCGETGSGKELVGRALHQGSDRARGPFLTIDCGALAETLLESELFGHVKGAFTGAFRGKKGLLEEADGGTLFLDETEDMSPAMQAKLLRFLETGMFRPVGSTGTRRSSVRIVAAVQASLEAAVESGRFRKDLLYRLKVLQIDLPPLREHLEDLPLLLSHLLEKIGSESSSSAAVVTPEAMRLFGSYQWPGNVRELENVLRRLCAFHHDRIAVADVARHCPDLIAGSSLSPTYGECLSLKEERLGAEKRAITSALLRAGGTRTAAAKALGLDRATLYRLMKRHELV